MVSALFLFDLLLYTLVRRQLLAFLPLLFVLLHFAVHVELIIACDSFTFLMVDATTFCEAILHVEFQKQQIVNKHSVYCMNFLS